MWRVQYKPLASKRVAGELCQHLLALVIEDLPTSAIDAAIRDGYEASAKLLGNMRIGRAALTLVAAHKRLQLVGT